MNKEIKGIANFMMKTNIAHKETVFGTYHSYEKNSHGFTMIVSKPNKIKRLFYENAQSDLISTDLN